MTSLLIELATTAAASDMGIKLDIAKLVSALMWPTALAILFFTYRKEIPSLFKAVVSRVSKLQVAGVSIELAKAKEFAPDWSATGAVDLRQNAQSGQVQDSLMMTFRTQLLGQGSWDYAEVDLGGGNEWLTSRLFIMAIVFGRMKGIKALVFLEKIDSVEKRFICWAEPQKVRWALAKRFPWFEPGYANAYSATLLQNMVVVVSNQGRLGTTSDWADPEPSIVLIREFLRCVQSPPGPPPADLGEWISLDPVSQTYEHARWLSSFELQDMLGADCNKLSVLFDRLDGQASTKQLQALLSFSGRFVAVTTKDHEFQYLLDRNLILEQVAKQMPF